MKEYTCKFMHFRIPQFDTRMGELVCLGPASRGGATLAYEERDGFLYAAVAYCNPKDNFNYHYGRSKSAGRLQQLLEKTKEHDDDKYFILPAEDGLDVIADFLVDGMGYVRRGPRQ